MNELFIYYRVRSADAPGAQAAVAQMQAQLRVDYPRLIARLLRWPIEDNGLQTWMETYASDDGISDAMRADIETRALALSPMLAGSRHIEVFIPWAW
jgi:hypothetical protein